MIDFARTSFSSYNTDALISTKKKSQGTRLKNLILSGELVPKELMRTPDDWKTSFKGHKLPSLRVTGGESGQVTKTTRPHEFHTQVSILTDLPPPHSGKNKTHTRSRSDVSGMNKVSPRQSSPVWPNLITLCAGEDPHSEVELRCRQCQVVTGSDFIRTPLDCLYCQDTAGRSNYWQSLRQQLCL